MYDNKFRKPKFEIESDEIEAISLRQSLPHEHFAFGSDEAVASGSDIFRRLCWWWSNLIIFVSMIRHFTACSSFLHQSKVCDL